MRRRKKTKLSSAFNAMGFMMVYFDFLAKMYDNQIFKFVLVILAMSMPLNMLLEYRRGHLEP